MKRESRFISGPIAGVRLEERADGSPPVLVGYGAVFFDASNPGTEYNFAGLWSDFRERIMPGAFDQALREDDVRGLFNHDVNQILGRTIAKTLRLSVDRVGLRYEIDPPSTEAAKTVVEAIRRGDVNGSSFSFTVDEENWRTINDAEDRPIQIRELNRVRLYDVGPVTFPAYQATSAGVRSAGDLDEAKASFEAWQQSQKQAEADWLERQLLMVNATARAVSI